MLRRCISGRPRCIRILTSIEALWSFCRFHARATPLPPMMKTIARMKITTSISTSEKPRLPREAEGPFTGRRPGSGRLIVMVSRSLLREVRAGARSGFATHCRTRGFFRRRRAPWRRKASCQVTLFVTQRGPPERGRRRSATIAARWSLGRRAREAPRASVGTRVHRGAARAQVVERGPEKGPAREVPGAPEARRRVGRLDGRRLRPRDPCGRPRDPEAPPRPRGPRGARPAPEDALGGRAPGRHALPEGPRGPPARTLPPGGRLARRRFRAPRGARARARAAGAGRVRHRAARPDRLEPGGARARPEGRQRDELRGKRGRRGQPRGAAPAGRERGDPLLRARGAREEPERELLPGRPADGADGRRTRDGGVVRRRSRSSSPAAKQDHTPEIVPLLADGNALVRAGTVEPPPPVRAGRPRAADPRALPRLVRLGARPGRRDGARRAAGLRERAPRAHARPRPRVREGGVRDDARPRRRQGAAGLDRPSRRQGHLGQDPRPRDARPPRQGRRRRPHARPGRPARSGARDSGRFRARRPRRRARGAAPPRRVQGGRHAARRPDGDPRRDGEARVGREDADPDRGDLRARRPDARPRRQGAREGPPDGRHPQGDRGAGRAARGRGRGPDGRARRERLGAARRVPRGHGQARRLRPPPRDRLRPAPPPAGRPRARRRPGHDARPRLAAHPRGPAGGRLEAPREGAADRRLPEAPRPRPVPGELLLAARGVRRVLPRRPEDDPDDRGDRPSGPDRSRTS